LREVVLAADLGAGSLRVGAVTAAGRIAASATIPLAAFEPQPGWSEIDPEIWWRGFATAAAAVLDRLGPGALVSGVCCVGLTRTQILLDGNGRALRPAILFRDRRATEEAAAVSRFFASDNPADAITAFHPLARLAWLAEHDAACFAALAIVAEPKDFLHFRLTGRHVRDTVTASRLDALRPLEALPDAIGRTCALLAGEAVAPWATIGAITCREPPFDHLAGRPVFAGAMDAWAAAVGAGCVVPGQGYDIAGTSEVVGLLAPERTRASGLVSLVWGDGAYQLGGPTQLGADGAAWCHATFRITGSLRQAVERAGALEPSPDLPMFLPYLAGERAPLWRDDLTGLFHGVRRSHSGEDFLWSALEGVAHAGRDILTLAATASGGVPREVRVCGGGARSDSWCQLKADVFGLPVLRARARETGLIGAAMAAWIGLGRYSTLVEAAQAMCPIERGFEPRAALRGLFEDRAIRYAEAKAVALDLADRTRAAVAPC
jgi:xylulokinase